MGKQRRTIPLSWTQCPINPRKEISDSKVFGRILFLLKIFFKRKLLWNVFSPDDNKRVKQVTPGKRTHRVWAVWALFVSFTAETHSLSTGTLHGVKGSSFSKVPWLHILLECLKVKQSVHCRKSATYIEIICKYFLLHEHYPEIAGDILMFILLSYLFTIFQNEIIVYLVP